VPIMKGQSHPCLFFWRNLPPCLLEWLSLPVVKATRPSSLPRLVLSITTTQNPSWGGHRDDLELALDKPVISFSMGLPAVFLLGGKTKDEVPVLAILVRPGDVMMLGGDCHLSFHGMARVLPAAVILPEISKELGALESFQITRESMCRKDSTTDKRSPEVCEEVVPNSDRAALTEYLNTHRININVRQVLPDDMDVLPLLTVRNP
jgi:2OG-Fe(II) oxygenase superfamily